ncbi:MAG: histidine kinase [Polaromonas sp.]|nr:histidine kinase [Polaromonas sp.]
MNSSISSTASVAGAALPGTWARIRQCLPELARHGLIVSGFCLLIGGLLWLAKSGQRFDVQLVYSFATGITSWLVIDGGRFFVDRHSPFGFPRGWRAVALIVAGVCIGFVVGTFTGDVFSGRTTRVLSADSPRFTLYMFGFTASAGIGISYFFYSIGKSAHLLAELEASRHQATDAQLMLLQSQLEPHMLFNTLANLRALISTDPARATDMLDRLINYLRATLQASRATTHSLQAEFDRLGDYLDLMSVRMGPRLAYTLDLPAALADVPIPTMLLQPLVENSIKHGLEPKVDGGSVRVSARRDGESVVLEVCDTGVGLGGRDELSSTSSPLLPFPSKSFGLGHVSDRLQTAYGSQATINLIAGEAHETWARITFPCKT